MTALQLKFIRNVASILKKSKNEYVKRVEEFNEGNDTIGTQLALVDAESTLVFCSQNLKVVNPLFDIKSFRKTQLHDAILWTNENVPYNGVTAFVAGPWLMVGYVVERLCGGDDRSIHDIGIDNSGIYLKDISNERVFIFCRLEEYLGEYTPSQE